MLCAVSLDIKGAGGRDKGSCRIAKVQENVLMFRNPLSCAFFYLVSMGLVTVDLRAALRTEGEAS